MKKKMFVLKVSRQLLISLGILAFLFLGTVGVILYGSGYRFGFDNGKPALSGTGILVATSTPDGAEVTIDGHLTTATNNTINLLPGEYDVKISKEGYFSWEKKITVQKEVVSKADALLLPNAPKLENITLTGVSDPTLDPSLTKIAYTIASQSALKNGVYVLDMNGGSLLSLGGNTTQIANDTFDQFSQAELSWSADGKSVIASISANRSSPSKYLLQANTLNQNPQDVTETFSDLQAQWDKDKLDKQTALLDTLQPQLKQIAINNFDIKAWSVDETKFIYVATQSAIIPTIINPPLIGTDSTPETRNITTDNVYVYDIKEDKNFLITGKGNGLGNTYQLAWLPDSKHLVFVHDKKIDIMDYDGANQTTIYAGPFIGIYAFPWPDGTKIAILTNLGNPDIEPHLYTIGLK